MPIYGLTDGTPALKEIGRIRKGGAKTSDYKPGPNLEHFRVTFREGENEAKEKFEAVYGNQPLVINVRLAFDTHDDNWFAWYTCYLKGGMLGMADGKKWHYLRDYRTHNVLVRNGELTKLGEERGISLDFDPEEPVYFYYSKRQKKDMPVFAKPEGRLSLTVHELGPFVYLTALTHSLHDIANLSSRLRAIEQKAQMMGLRVSQLPLVYRRQKDEISKPIGDGRGMVDEWLVELEVNPDIAEIATRYFDRQTVLALSSGDPRPQQDIGLLPEPENGYHEDEPEQEEVEEIKPGKTFEASEQQGEIEQKQSKKDAEPRPWSPEILKEKIQAAIQDKETNGCEARDKAEADPEMLRGIVATNLEACFAGNKEAKDMRHTVLMYLCGEGSTKKLNEAQLITLKRWVNAQPDSGGAWLPDPLAIKEANAAYEAGLVKEGQGKLL